MTLPADNALSLLLSQHTAEQSMIDAAHAAEPKVTVTFSPLPSPKIKAKKLPKAPTVTTTAAALGLYGIIAGTLDASGFMVAMRSAGKRLNESGFPYTAPLEVRGDLIKAIAGYVGYDPRADFGTQETAARAKAQRELSGCKVTAGPSTLRNASKSLDGFVAGLPNHHAKALANLLAQRASTVDAIAAASAAGDETRLALEQERLSHLRSQIEAMGYDD